MTAGVRREDEYAVVAQRIARLVSTQKVVGSNPTRGGVK